MTHTPGPWEWQDVPKGMLLGPGGEIVIEDHAVEEADARLIAAAPDQHDALVEILDLCGHLPAGNRAASAIARIARTAIAKAKGTEVSA